MSVCLINHFTFHRFNSAISETFQFRKNNSCTPCVPMFFFFFFFCSTDRPTFTRGRAMENETFYWDGLTLLLILAVISSNWIGEFVHVVPLHWPHEVNTLGHVCGRCIFHWHNLTSSSTLSSAEATPVRLEGQSSEGVPGLPLPNIYIVLQ